MDLVKRTERGWGGHFIASERCLFRRNTLIECGETRIVVSTVGVMRVGERFETIGLNRHYETMAFHARKFDGHHWDADVSRELEFESPWKIRDITDWSDNQANEMHETVVNEIINKIAPDATACKLAIAILQGDMVAAAALADLVVEMTK